MAIRVCVAGVTGWTGSMVAKGVLDSPKLELAGAIARRKTGEDVGRALGRAETGLRIVSTLEEALRNRIDVLVDFTKPDSVKGRAADALKKGVRVVIGTSGLTSADYDDLEKAAREARLGIIAAGNFSITAALAKHFALIAAKYIPSWEIVDYAHGDKPDAPSGTTREIAERLSEIRKCELEIPLEKTIGPREARGATIGGAQVHSLRLPGFVIAFETIFGLPNERLTIRHDAGSGADPYVGGALLAVERVMEVTGMVRGLDTLLFG